MEFTQFATHLQQKYLKNIGHFSVIGTGECPFCYADFVSAVTLSSFSYPNVQAFQKVYNKAEGLIIEYNEELRAWKNQTEQKKEKSLEQPKKESVLEKLHLYQQEGRQQPKRSVKKKSMDRER